MNDYATIHQPVLLERCVELVAPALDHDGAVAVDCTLGLAGHTIAFLKASPRARLIGIDRDAQALAMATERVRAEGLADRFTPVHAAFDAFSQVLDDVGVRRVEMRFSTSRNSVSRSAHSSPLVAGASRSTLSSTVGAAACRRRTLMQTLRTVVTVRASASRGERMVWRRGHNRQNASCKASEASSSLRRKRRDSRIRRLRSWLKVVSSISSLIRNRSVADRLSGRFYKGKRGAKRFVTAWDLFFSAKLKKKRGQPALFPSGGCHFPGRDRKPTGRGQVIAVKT